VRKQLRRSQVLKFFAQFEPCLVGMEACGGMHYWARELTKLGHEVKAMAPAFVKPYLKSNKNDANDAEVICEAVLHLHHSRELLVGQRMAIGNHIRGILHEYGIVLPRGTKALSKLSAILEDAENNLPDLTRQLLAMMKEQHDDLQVRSDAIQAQLQAWSRGNENSQRLQTIPGVGLLTATALAAHVDNGSDFCNGRQLSAYLGLTPRQASSGGKQRLLGISKRGDGYLRKLLIHGARTVIRHLRMRLQQGKPGGNPWLEQLLQRCHPNEAAVALANKMARIAWVLVSRQESYRPSWA